MFDKKAYMKEYRKNNNKEISTYFQTYRKHNLQKEKERRFKYYQKNRAHEIEMAHTWWIKKTYKISKEQFNQMRTAQDNQCAICGSIFIKTPCVDHNHKTGVIRALLCQRCNSGLGYFQDNIKYIEQAILYLKKWGHKE